MNYYYNNNYNRVRACARACVRAVGLVVLGCALFGAGLFVVGVVSIADGQTRNDAAKFAEWVKGAVK